MLGAAGWLDATAMIARACLDLEASERRARIGAGEALAFLGSEEAAVVVEGRRYRAIGAERKGLIPPCCFPPAALRLCVYARSEERRVGK